MDDIDAILAASDSEEEELNVEDIDLEDILREQSDEEEEEQEGKSGTFSKSLVATVGYEHSEFLETADFLTSMQSSQSRCSTEEEARLTGDSQMLSQLLGEDNFQDTETGSPPLVIRSSSAMDIDAIIDSVENDRQLSEDRMEGGDETEFWESTGLSPMKLGDLLRGVSSDSVSKLQVMNGKDFKDISNDGGFAGELTGAAALELAASRERALLTAGKHDLVSPLQVKRAGRRNRPGAGLVKVEVLESISRQLRKNSQYMLARRQEQMIDNHPHRQRQPSRPDINSTSSSAGKSVPPGPGLPSALATHARYVAIGTEVGLVLVFDHCQEIKQIIKVSDSSSSSLSSAASTLSAKVLKQTSKASANSGGDSSGGASDSVSALDISPSGEFLACGYESGRVVLWDIAKGSVLKNVTDAHKAKITFAQFYHSTEPSLITVDSTGAVNKLLFSKLFWATYVADVECLLDGAAGPIPSVSVIPYWYSPPCESKREGMEEPFACIMLIGLSSSRSTFIIEVHPEVRVLYKWAKPPEMEDSPKVTPCLAWTWPKNESACCLLARGWGDTLELLRVTLPQDPRPGEAASSVSSFKLHQTIPVSVPVLAVGWLGAETLIYLSHSAPPGLPGGKAEENGDHQEQGESQAPLGLQLSVYDITKAACLESLPLDKNGTSQNWDSKQEGNTATLQTNFRTCRARLYLLGDEELRSATVQSWEQRIDSLLESGEWLEALAVAVDHFERASKATNQKYVEGQTSVKYMADLLLRYLRLAVDNAPNASPDASDSSAMLVKSHYQMLAGVCLEYCAITERLDLLYGPIFQKFAMVGQLRTLLDTLEPYVLNDRIKYIAPEPMAIFIEHCQQRNDLPAVERVLLHLDVKILDFDHIIKLLKAHKLYSSVIHVYTKGLHDYVTPLEVLMDEILCMITSGGPLLHALSYKALLYLRHMFRGEGFPDGTPMEEDHRLSARAQLLYFLLTAQTSSDKAETEVIASLSYPYLRALLSIDVKETLRTLECGLDCLERMYIASDEMESDHFAEVFKVCRSNKSEVGFMKCPHPQFVATALRAVLIAKDAGRAPTFTKGPWVASALQNKNYPWPENLPALLYEFFSKYMETGKLKLSDGITGAVLSYLVDFGLSNEAQLCEVIKHLGPRATSSDRLLKSTSLVLKRCEEAAPPLNRVAAKIHQQKATHARSAETARVHFNKAMAWILTDKMDEFQKQVFSYIDDEVRAAQNGSSKMNVQDISSAVLSKIHKLVEIDQAYTVRIIADMFGEDHSQVFVELRAVPSSQFSYMDAAIKSEKPDGSPTVVFTSEDTNTYIHLMCEFQPEAVYKYLRTHDNYNLDQCLRWCEEHKVTDAQSYLLEKRGDVAGALDLVLGSLLASLQAIKGAVTASSGQSPSGLKRQNSRHVDGRSVLESTPEGLKAKALLLVAVELCQRATPPLRNTSGLLRGNRGQKRKPSVSLGGASVEVARQQEGDEQAGVQLWFRMLDRLFDAKAALAHQETHYQAVILQGVVNWTIQRVLDGMLDRVPLHLIIRKITDDHASQKLGDFKDVFLNMVETYTFETNIFSTAAAIIYEDMGIRTREKYSIKASGIHVKSIEGSGLGPRLQRYKATSVPSEGILRVMANGTARLDAIRPFQPDTHQEVTDSHLPGYDRWRAETNVAAVEDSEMKEPEGWNGTDTQSKVQRLRRSRKRLQEKEILKNISTTSLVQDQLLRQKEQPDMVLHKAPANIPKPTVGLLSQRIPGQLPFEPKYYRSMDQASIIS